MQQRTFAHRYESESPIAYHTPNCTVGASWVRISPTGCKAMTAIELVVHVGFAFVKPEHTLSSRCVAIAHNVRSTIIVRSFTPP